VTYLSHVKDSLNKATLETTRMMSAQLRAEARASGWPSHIVRNLYVSHTDGGFSVHAHKDHRSEVLNLEYGTPSTQPTAAIRRYENRTADAEKFFLGRTMKHIRSSR
jgi:hypothetical protein